MKTEPCSIKSLDDFRQAIYDFESAVAVAEYPSTAEFVPTYGMGVECTKTPEFRTHEGFVAAVGVFCKWFARLDVPSAKAMRGESKEAYEEICNGFDDISIGLMKIQDYYENEVSEISIFNAVNESRYDIIAILRRVYAEGEIPPESEWKSTWRKFLEANDAMMDDIYRDEPVPPVELPDFSSDEPMAWPKPDERELAAHLPDAAESPHHCSMDWIKKLPSVDVSPFFSPTLSEADPLLTADWAKRLWGYSRRILSSQRFTKKQIVQMPRIAAYPIYDAFFEFMKFMNEAIDNYERGTPGIQKASWVAEQWGTNFKLSWYMEKEAEFVPREYFQDGKCNHAAYLMILRGLFAATFDRLMVSVKGYETREIARLSSKIKMAFDSFLADLTKPFTGWTRLTYHRRIHGKAEDFRELFRELQAELVAIECEMAKEKATPDEEVPKVDLTQQTKDELVARVNAKVKGKKERTSLQISSRGLKEALGLWFEFQHRPDVVGAAEGRKVSKNDVFETFKTKLAAHGINTVEDFTRAIDNARKQFPELMPKRKKPRERQSRKNSVKRTKKK